MSHDLISLKLFSCIHIHPHTYVHIYVNFKCEWECCRLVRHSAHLSRNFWSPLKRLRKNWHKLNTIVSQWYFGWERLQAFVMHAIDITQTGNTYWVVVFDTLCVACVHWIRWYNFKHWKLPSNKQMRVKKQNKRIIKHTEIYLRVHTYAPTSHYARHKVDTQCVCAALDRLHRKLVMSEIVNLASLWLADNRLLYLALN